MPIISPRAQHRDVECIDESNLGDVMELDLKLTLDHSCAVCKQRKRVRPQERLRQETVEACLQELREGKAVTFCVDCGRPYDFSCNRSALRRYIYFVAENTNDDALYHELRAIARTKR